MELTGPRATSSRPTGSQGLTESRDSAAPKEPAASHRPTASRWLVPLVGAVAALLYANFLIASALDGRLDLGKVISTMEEPGQPYSTLLRVTDVVCAVLVLAILPFFRRALPPGRWSRLAIGSMAAFALGAAAAAAIPSRCQAGWTCSGTIDPWTQVHDGLSIASDTFLYIAMAAVWCAVRRTGPVWLRRAAGWGLILGGLVSSAVFGYFNATRDPAWGAGASQRVHVLLIAAWIVVLGVAGGWASGSGRDREGACSPREAGGAAADPDLADAAATSGPSAT